MQSPPCRPILRTIRELAAISLRGILLIVNGNSGDLLNFGLATERAKKESLKVMMLPIFDNYANGDLPSCKRRGIQLFRFPMKYSEFYCRTKWYNFDHENSWSYGRRWTLNR